jgi:hypothetical protein
MDTRQLIEMIKSSAVTAPYFAGVCPADVAIQRGAANFNNAPCFLVVNTHDQHQLGQHWLVFFYEAHGGCLEVFDSYGIAPYAYPNLVEYFETRRGTCTDYNTKCLQSTESNVCGAHCLFYTYYKCKALGPKRPRDTKQQRPRGTTLRNIITKYYINDVDYNDCMVLAFAEKKFNSSVKLKTAQDCDEIM